MSYHWCHGPSCHTYSTQDRVRGSKGSKVLRTRKIKVNNNGYPSGFYKYFCSNTCYNNFADKHAEQIVRIEPRTEPLETPIEDPTKEKHTTSWGHTYYDHTIKKRGVDTSMEQEYIGYRKDIYMETKTNHDYTRRNRFTGESLSLIHI